MALSILDLIKSQVSAQTGGIQIPEQQKNTVLNGLTDSIFGSLSQTVTGSTLNGALSGLIPTIMGKLSGILKYQDGDGDVDFNDIILTLKGGGRAQAQKTGGGILGSILGKVLGGTR